MAYNNLGSVMSGLGFGDQQIPMLPIPQQSGGLGQLAPQPTESPADVLSKEKARLTGGLSDDVLMEILRKEASGDGLSALETAKNTQTKALTDMLMKQSEYSGLDKVMAGLANINLAPVPKGYSSIAYGLQGTANAADKFATLKDKYKQTALELQAKEAQKAYDDQWAEAKQSRQLLMADAMARERNASAERRAAINNEAKEKIAKAKALVSAGKVPPNTMARLIADAETAVQNDFANGRITNDATERQMLKDKYVAEGVQKILGDEWTTSIPSAIPQSQVPTAQGFQGDPNAIMGELARIPNEADKIAAGQQYEQQLAQSEVPSATPTSQAPSTKPAALTKQELEVKAERDKKLNEGQVKQILDAPAAQVELLQHSAALDQMDQKVDQILASAGLGTATGTILGRLPTFRGSTADTEADIDSLRAKVGFAVLQEMRAASKTGGALGSISDAEEKLLQAALEPFADKFQTTEHLQTALNGLKLYIAGAKERAAKAYAIQYGHPVGEARVAPNNTVIDAPAEVAPTSAKSRLKKFN